MDFVLNLKGLRKTDKQLLWQLFWGLVVGGIIGYIINYIYDNRVDKLLLNLSFHNIKCIFYKKN
jgi:L-cystine uptake protein TcyP (sodium:dicarboxylate symporter family)